LAVSRGGLPGTIARRSADGWRLSGRRAALAGGVCSHR